ncbi:MAG: ATP-dependent DNA ligase, partial [Thermoproteota archaeon]
MRFSHLTEFFEKLEEISSRNQMTDLLAKLFNEATAENIDKICYFTMGEIAAGYKNIYLGIGEEMIKSAIAMAAAVDEQEVDEKFKEIGDLGEVADRLLQIKEKKFKQFFTFQKNLSVEDVHRGLMKIATASGSGSQEVKKKTLAAMLADATSQERIYLVRLATGAMRLGVGDMTVLDGLSTAFFGSKEKRSELEHAYNVCSDIGYVAKILAERGLEGVKNIMIALNRPIRPMLAQRVSEMSQIMEKIESDVVSAEEKFDGERIQAHKDGDKVKLFSRRLTDVTSQFPEVVKGVSRDVKADNAILDGEVVAYDFDKGVFYSFQKLMKRRRKYEVEKYVEEIPVRYMVFDVLYADRKSWLKRSYPERRRKVENIVKKTQYTNVTGHVKSSELDEIDEFFQDCLNRGLEGIVCKSCAEDSYYRAGAREWM